MKKRNKKISVILAILLAFATVGIGACKNGGTSSDTSSDPTINVGHVCEHVCDICGKCQDESCNDVVCKKKCVCKEGLHTRKIGATSDVLVKSGAKSDYVIIFDGSSTEGQTAAGFIASHINSAVGRDCIKAESYDPETHKWVSDKKYISVGVTPLFTQAGLSMPAGVDLSGAGYYIKTAAHSLFIEVGDLAGYQMGAIAFLQELLGYDMINYTGYTVYEKVQKNADILLYDMEIIEKPDFAYRIVPSSTIISSTVKYGMGYTSSNVFIQKNFREYHNTFGYLPPNEYYKDHPEWYGQTVDETMTKDSLNNGQLCYTAHGRTYDESGNPNGTYGEMLSTVAESMIVEIKKDFNAKTNNIAFTAQDSSDWCNCPACVKEQQKYGTNSANCILFCNDLEKLLNAKLKELGIEREMKIYFFAYLTATTAPATKNADGTYSPIDGLKCSKNVGVIYCPIQANFYNPIDSDINAFYAEQMYKWNAVCDNVSVWLYEVHFENFFYPYCNWPTIADNARFCFKNNANYFFNQDQFNISSPLAFTDLKYYLNAKMSFDTSYDQLEYTKKYFKYTYGDASETMYELFRQIQIYYEELHNTYPSVIDGTLKEKIANKKYWPRSVVEHWLNMIDEAYEKIADLAVTDPTAYKETYDKINLESLPFRYMLCSLHKSEYTSEEIYNLRVAFKTDCEYFKIDRTVEAKADLEGIYKSWGIL